MNCRCMVVLAVFLLATLVLAEGEIWEEDEKEVLIRSERGAKNSKDPCRYVKGPWSECDTKTNTRSRQLTLKKKDGTASATCEPTKTIQKKCKKACRYEKGAWSACSAQNEMVRTDTLKEKSDPSCEQKRVTTKKCKNNKTNRPTKANKANNDASVSEHPDHLICTDIRASTYGGQILEGTCRVTPIGGGNRRNRQ